MKNVFIGFIIIVVVATLFVWVGNIAMTKSAKVDCLQWQAQAQEFNQFYLTKWQSEQCKSVGIIVNAPIK